LVRWCGWLSPAEHQIWTQNHRSIFFPRTCHPAPATPHPNRGRFTKLEFLILNQTQARRLAQTEFYFLIFNQALYELCPPEAQDVRYDVADVFRLQPSYLV
jgi:hypothetical protein